MILLHQKDNHLYLAIQDFEDSIDEIFKAIKQFPANTPKTIRKILNKNFLLQPLERQKNYINSISTYIDDITDNNEQYFFHLHILPKDLNIIFKTTETEREKTIKKIEALSFNLFKLYSTLCDNNNKSLELFKHYQGSSFLQLEAKFYIDKLEKLYSALINHKINHKNKIICSDKRVGIEIHNLNIMEKNPLKNYQFIKEKYQKDLVRFIYSCIKFLYSHKLQIFKTNCPDEYLLLQKLVHKFNNLLIKISGKKNITDDRINKESLHKYLQNYKNKKEVKNNKNIYHLVYSIFFTQLKKDKPIFPSIDLTKIFEKIVEKKLYGYIDNLYIGDEVKKRIYAVHNKIIDFNLDNSKYLLDSKQLSQYPDFLIKDRIGNNKIYHIIDAKYKLKDKLPNESDTRQILTYSVLFNKNYSQNLDNQKNIKKIIIFASKSTINLDTEYQLSINESILDIDNIPGDNNCFEEKENLFDSKIFFIGIPLLTA